MKNTLYLLIGHTCEKSASGSTLHEAKQAWLEMYDKLQYAKCNVYETDGVFEPNCGAWAWLDYFSGYVHVKGCKLVETLDFDGFSQDDIDAWLKRKYDQGILHGKELTDYILKYDPLGVL